MKKGRRAKILLDSIDIEIISMLKKKPMAIMELRGKMKLKHYNLKAHLIRLNKLNLIKQTPVVKSRKIMLSIPKRKDIGLILKTFKRR